MMHAVIALALLAAPALAHEAGFLASRAAGAPEGWATLPDARSGLLLRIHDAPNSFARPDGWSYPFSCCSGVDCRPVDAAAVQDTDGGFTVPSGETIGSYDSRVKDSPDGLYHWCTVGGAPDGKTLCLFVPPRGM